MNCEHKEIVVKLLFTMYLITKIFFLIPLPIEFGHFPNKSSIFETFFSFPFHFMQFSAQTPLPHLVVHRCLSRPSR